MPAATIVAFQTQSAVSSTSLPFTTPTWTYEAGDKLLICVGIKNTSALSGPGTMNSIANTEGAATSIRSRWFWKNADSTDAAGGVTYTFTAGTAGTGMAVWLVVRGAASTPVEAASVNPSGAQGFTITHTGISTLGPERLLLITEQVADTYTFASPTGGGTTTDVYNYASGAGNTQSSRSMGGDSEVIASQSNTGNRSVVGTAAGAAVANWWIANLLAIEPLNVTPPDTTPPAAPTGLTATIVP